MNEDNEPTIAFRQTAGPDCPDYAASTQVDEVSAAAAQDQEPIGVATGDT